MWQIYQVLTGDMNKIVWVWDRWTLLIIHNFTSHLKKRHTYLESQKSNDKVVLQKKHILSKKKIKILRIFKQKKTFRFIKKKY